MDLRNIDEETFRKQAAAAGFASVEVYIHSLLQRDAERLAIQAGFDAIKAGRCRPFELFDREFRERYGLSPRN